MSFVANLRTQKADQPNLQLCYLLTMDTPKQQWQVHLRLHNREQGPIHLAERYLLQRAHTQHPPGFIDKDDLDILQKFTQSHTDWPIRELTTNTPLSWPLLKNIIRTGRCYYRSKLVSQGENQPAAPYWYLDQSAHYQIRWHLPKNSHTRCFLLQNELLFQKIKHDTVIIGQAHAMTGNTDPGNTDPILNHQKLYQLRLAASALNKWPTDLNLPLPLPTPPPIEKLSAKLQLLLFCAANTTGHGHVTLRFSVVDKNACCLPERLTDASKPTSTYWDGHKLKQLTVTHEDCQKALQQLSKLLDSILQRTSTAYQWQVEGDQQWQTLFTQNYASLQAMDTELVVGPAFKYHYVACTNWNIHIKETDRHRLQLLIYSESHGDKVPLHTILKQLQHYNHQRQNQQLQIPLDDGRILLLPVTATSQLMEELADLTFDAQGFYLDRTQSYRLAQLDRALSREAEWTGNLQALNQAIAIQQSPVVLDSNCQFVTAKLRPYQWLGVCWIHHLKQQRANGLLADDMGLGKTLQTISLLAFEKQQGLLNKPALIVLPLSLLHNWANELKKFAPQLSMRIIHGNKRHSYWQALPKVDALLTTYQSAALDIEYWQKQTLSWLILDEAQNIKNPKTRWSQALREIPSDNRLCLSGTPMENHLGELWSIMDFLMPGCLGSQGHFRRVFRKPIETEGNSQRLQQLLERVAPFMLRRTKDQIATDLPPKTEIIQRIPLDTKQREFYNRLKSTAQEELLHHRKTQENTSQQNIAILTALLKLRQACCDPSLLDRTDLPSAKKSFCIDMLEELVAEDRAVLVFSQFTNMLSHLQEELAKREIDSLMLTGKTQNRQGLVEAFQQGAAPVFFISLKAGGTGLNLTRADTVIHYDPWWNAAAENQASDRAHRIGQHKPVFVYRLIAADTIEEKIAHLQQQKTLLIDHIDQQAKSTADNFSLKFEELLSLLGQEKLKEETT